jgi:hypothetical protein
MQCLLFSAPLPSGLSVRFRSVELQPLLTGTSHVRHGKLSQALMVMVAVGIE